MSPAAAQTLQTPAGTVSTSGLPQLPELGLGPRAIVEMSAAADVALRTALASVLSVTILPWALSGGARRERSRLDFYRDLAQARDPEAAFPRPPEGIAVTDGPAARFSFKAPGGRVDLLHFESPFVALNPALRDDYATFTNNGTAWAQHWRHDDGPRPTLCVIHGFGASPYWINSAFFALPWLYGRGYDVLLYVLPFHGPRHSPRMPVNGAGMFAHGLAHLNEAIAHGVHDFRVLIDYLEMSGVDSIGVTGLSLGGYLSALLAAVEPRLRVVIPNAAVTDIGPLLRSWFPISGLLALAERSHQLGYDEVVEGLAVHCPLTYAPVVPKERLMIIGGLGDRLAPPRQSAALWEHWDRPRIHWYPGNHTLHVNRGAYLKRMREFMNQAGFAP